MTTAPEADQDYGAAEGPPGFQFGRDGEGIPVLNAVEADQFPDRAQDAVSGLLWLGYLTAEAHLFGHSFTLKTLTRGDRLSVSLITKEWEETLGMSDAYQAATVAASLLAYDGRPVADLDKRADRQQQIRTTFDVVRGWYDPVLEALYEQVVLLNNRQNAAFVALQGK